MKIKNLKRFITRIIVLGLIILFVILLTNKTFSKVEYDKKTIYVANGDTLWSIASEQQNYNSYYYGKNINDILSDIKSINKLNDSFIYEGQKLVIPTL